MNVKVTFIEGMKHYLGIVATPALESDQWSYVKFTEDVKTVYFFPLSIAACANLPIYRNFIPFQAMTRPPFDKLTNRLTLPFLQLRREAAYLYDAVKLYAWSLKQSLLMAENPYDGTAIISRLFNRSYKRYYYLINNLLLALVSTI